MLPPRLRRSSPKGGRGRRGFSSSAPYGGGQTAKRSGGGKRVSHYHLKAHFPTTAPSAPVPSTPSVYQVPTNTIVLSPQCRP